MFRQLPLLSSVSKRRHQTAAGNAVTLRKLWSALFLRELKSLKMMKISS